MLSEATAIRQAVSQCVASGINTPACRQAGLALCPLDPLKRQNRAAVDFKNIEKISLIKKYDS
jgi:hypothetical protein